MHDRIYRLSVAYQNVGYNQPTHTGFYLGDGMLPLRRPAIVTRAPKRVAETIPRKGSGAVVHEKRSDLGDDHDPQK